MLDNAIIADDSAELAATAALWARVASGERWTPEWARLALAAADNASLCLQVRAWRVGSGLCVGGRGGGEGVGEGAKIYAMRLPCC